MGEEGGRWIRGGELPSEVFVLFCLGSGGRFVLFCLGGGARVVRKRSAVGLMSVLCGERKRPIVLCLCAPARGKAMCVYVSPKK